MIDAILLSVAGTLVVSHFAGPAWRWLTAHKPRLVPQLQAIEAEASSVVSTVKKEVTAMAESPVVSDAAAKIGAAIAALRTRAQAAEQALSDKQAEIDAAAAKQGELDQANAHVADLTGQVEQLKADLAAEQANHADDVNATVAIANQVDAG
jgi:chromosome segregation ATPase